MQTQKQKHFQRAILQVIRVKSAVARLNMSPSPILFRAVFMFSSEFRENLQKCKQTSQFTAIRKMVPFDHHTDEAHLGMASCRFTFLIPDLHCLIFWLLRSALSLPSGTSCSKGDTSSMLSVSPSYGTSITS